MNILLNILTPLFCLLIGYIMGAFPTAIVVGKVFYHQDPRDFGSKNAGGTNAGRLWGKKVGFCIILFDMIKTIAPIWICWAIIVYSGLNNPEVVNATLWDNGILYYYLAGLGAVLGHCWPIFAHFKGGKAVSNVMGITTCTSWLLFICGFAYFGILKLKKYVSLASICCGIIMCIAAWALCILSYTIGAGGPTASGYVFGANTFLWAWGYGIQIGQGWEFATIVTLMSTIMIFRHHENIARLKAGTERKIKWMK